MGGWGLKDGLVRGPCVSGCEERSACLAPGLQGTGFKTLRVPNPCGCLDSPV